MKKFIRILLILLLQVAVLAGILEAALRFFGLKPQIALVNPEGPFLVHPQLRWRMRPNFDGTWSGVPFQTNSLGLRDDEITKPKPADEFRILVLGGSISTGYQMERSQTFPDRLQDLLGRTYFSQSTVINAAIPGYAPFQHLMYFRDSGQLLQPNLVIIDFSVNDVLDTQLRKSRTEFRGGGAFFKLTGGSAPESLSAQLRDLARRTATYSALRWVRLKMVGKVLSKKELDAEKEQIRLLSLGDGSPQLEESWRETLADLSQLVALIRSHQAEPVIIMFPTREQLGTSGLDHPQKRMTQYCLDNKIPFLDLLAPFRERYLADGTSDLLFLDDEHPAPTGHHIGAERLHRLLLSRLDAPRRSPEPTPDPKQLSDQPSGVN